MTLGYLIVRVEGRTYGLPLDHVEEVSDVTEVLDAPRVLAALRGMTPLRGRLVPLVHLGALLGGRAAPPDRGATAVLVRLGNSQIALEVDDAEEVVREAPLPVPRGEDLPWATGIARPQAPRGLVPILDLEALEERMQ